MQASIDHGQRLHLLNHFIVSAEISIAHHRVEILTVEGGTRLPQ